MDADVIEKGVINEAWRMRAKVQGLVCLICCEPPPFDERETFFDTGVCAHCAKEQISPSPLTA